MEVWVWALVTVFVGKGKPWGDGRKRCYIINPASVGETVGETVAPPAHPQACYQNCGTRRLRMGMGQCMGMGRRMDMGRAWG